MFSRRRRKPTPEARALLALCQQDYRGYNSPAARRERAIRRACYMPPRLLVAEEPIEPAEPGEQV